MERCNPQERPQPLKASEMPELVLRSQDHTDAIYDFQVNFQPKQIVPKISYPLMRIPFHPHMHFEQTTYAQDGNVIQLGFEDTVAAGNETGDQYILIANHQDMPLPKPIGKRTSFDQYLMAVAAHHSPALRKHIGRISVLAKAELGQKTDLSRAYILHMGGIFTFRHQDTLDEDGKEIPGLAAENEYARDRMEDCCAEVITRGRDLAVFPEGGRAGLGAKELNPVKKGLPHIMARAKPVGRLGLISMGIHFSKGRKSAARPDTYVSTPRFEDWSNVDFNHQVVTEELGHSYAMAKLSSAQRRDNRRLSI